MFASGANHLPIVVYQLEERNLSYWDTYVYSYFLINVRAS